MANRQQLVSKLLNELWKWIWERIKDFLFFFLFLFIFLRIHLKLDTQIEATQPQRFFSLIDVFLIIWNKSHPIFKSALANFVKKSCFFLLFILFSVDYWQEMKEVGEVELCKFNLW